MCHTNAWRYAMNYKCSEPKNRVDSTDDVLFAPSAVDRLNQRLKAD